METEIISIIVNAVVVIAGYIANSQMTKYRIDQLERKVEKHNNIVHRTYILEEKVSNLEEMR